MHWSSWTRPDSSKIEANSAIKPHRLAVQQPESFNFGLGRATTLAWGRGRLFSYHAAGRQLARTRAAETLKRRRDELGADYYSRRRSQDASDGFASD